MAKCVWDQRLLFGTFGGDPLVLFIMDVRPLVRSNCSAFVAFTHLAQELSYSVRLATAGVANMHTCVIGDRSCG